jgi:very-short-patch-repair endonuclease
VAFSEQGLPPPELQVTIFGRNQTMIARVDFPWRRHGVIVEADGLLKYDSGEAAIRQLERDRLLRDLGYEVVHFTWKELFSDPQEVTRRIRDAFRRPARYRRR